MFRTRKIALSAAVILTVLVPAVFAQKHRKSVSASEVNGTYKMNFRGRFSKMSNDIQILALGRGKVRIAFDLIYPYTLRNGEISVNMGGLDSEAAIEGDTAVYRSDEYGKCTISIWFVRPGAIKVTQEGTDADCGFGHNVFASGDYRKVSSRKPDFDDEP